MVQETGVCHTEFTPCADVFRAISNTWPKSLCRRNCHLQTCGHGVCASPLATRTALGSQLVWRRIQRRSGHTIYFRSDETWLPERSAGLGGHTSGDESGLRGIEAAKVWPSMREIVVLPPFCSFGRRSIPPSSKHNRDLPAFTSEDDARANFGKLPG
jgi:hypothetical protein